MYKFALITLVLFIAGPGVLSAATSAPLSAQRIKLIETFLPAQPAGPGKPITDRAYWSGLAENPAYKSQIDAADKILMEPLPDQSDDLYLEFSRNGNRANFERVAFKRRKRLMPLVVAECLQNEGRYLAAIEQLADALCDERTWVLPAHDRKLKNFNGKTINIDLFSSALGFNLAITDYLLNDKLSASVRSRLTKEIDRRILAPFIAMIRGERKRDGWLTTTNNWNSVCLAGVTGAALIQVESARDRAEFVAAAEQYSQYFLSGFTADGYCSEGLSYWNYGFGEFALLSENIRMATSGKIDLLADSKAKKPAAYGAHIEIISGVSPAFADCPIKARPSRSLMWLLNHKYGWGMKEYAQLDAGATLRSLADLLILYDVQQAMDNPEVAKGTADGLGIRTWFPDAGVYIGRPNSATAGAMGVALKGGDNAEHHNHNDLGSYVVVAGTTPILLDPGAEVYTKRTFSAQRYDSKLLNSYGHPVPVIAGKLQEKGKESKGRIISTDFTDTTDTIIIDITTAYKVPALKKLVRTFQYVRGDNPSFSIKDEVEFRSPETFETALISAGEFATDDKTSVTVKQNQTSARISIVASAPYDLKTETIEENASVKPNRLAIRLSEPVTSATVTAVVTLGL